MGDTSRKPIVLVFAGPNGSGKTTVTRGFSVVGTYVNADDMKKESSYSEISPNDHWPEAKLRALLGL